MEMTGVIEALSRLKFQCRVIVQTDSKYVVDSIMKGWAVSWRRNGWKKSDKKPALNPDLWEKLLNLCEAHEVEFNWIKGHAGHSENERCDELAVIERDKFKNAECN
jgi:ribonuclease HI